MVYGLGMIAEITSLDATVTSWLFMASGAMLWLGWILLPVHIGAFFKEGDFPGVRERLRVWIWLYRVHLFGHIVAIMALVAFTALLGGTPMRILLLPAVAVCSTGLLVAVLAQAFYYHFGALGAVSIDGKSSAEIAGFVNSLVVPTEYVTCFVRFGRVFFGLGQVVLGAGLLFGGLMPLWVSLSALVLGLAAMAITLGLPDNLEAYSIVFHLNAFWLVGVGVMVLRMA